MRFHPRSGPEEPEVKRAAAAGSKDPKGEVKVKVERPVEAKTVDARVPPWRREIAPIAPPQEVTRIQNASRPEPPWIVDKRQRLEADVQVDYF